MGGTGNTRRAIWYTLDANHLPIPCFDLATWSEWMEVFEYRRVAATTSDDWRVSTVFLGLDHNWFDGDPVLFETMVFWDGETGRMERYVTWAEAAAGHERICSMLEYEARQAQRTSLDAIKAILEQGRLA